MRWVVGLLLFLGAAAAAEQIAQFGQAVELMEVRGEYRAAVALLEEAAAGADRPLAARALLMAGYCREKLGDPEAWQVYQRALREFGDIPEAVSAARARLVRLGHAESTVAGARHKLRVKRLIPVGKEPRGIALARDGAEIFVANYGESSVSVVDARSLGVVRKLFACQGPAAVACTADGSRVYVVCSDSLAAIDPRNGSIRTWRLPPGSACINDLLLSRDEQRLYVPACRAGLLVLDIRSGRLTSLYRDFYVLNVAQSPDGRVLYVSLQGGGPGGSWGHDAIGKLDAATGKLLGSWHGFPNVGGQIAVSPDGRYVWEDSLDACSSRAYDHLGCPAVPATVIHVFEAGTNRLLRSLALPPSSIPMAISPDGEWAAVGGWNLFLLDTRTLEMESVLLERNSSTVRFSPDGKRIYATLDTAGVLAVIECDW